jgi:hypothetical protein
VYIYILYGQGESEGGREGEREREKINKTRAIAPRLGTELVQKK